MHLRIWKLTHDAELPASDHICILASMKTDVVPWFHSLDGMMKGFVLFSMFICFEAISLLY